MNDDLVFKQASGCLAEEMGEDTLLYNPETATTLHLNNSSALVWRICDGQLSVGDIVTALREAYPEQADAIEGDVYAALTELSEQAALVAVD